MARRGQPDRRDRERAGSDRKHPRERVRARAVVDRTRHPGTERGAGVGAEIERSEDRPVAASLEDLRGNRAEDRGQAVAEQAL